MKNRYTVFAQMILTGVLLATVVLSFPLSVRADDEERPNILFCIADDWGWPHASAYGDPVCKTPAFDQIAKQGVLFTNAYISAPSCTPSRNAILTGQYHWRLGWGANLHSMLDTKHQTFSLLLQEAGYAVGHWRKAWGPGKLTNWTEEGKGHPAGPHFNGFDQFLDQWDRSKPFCFWLGAFDPHRGYKSGSGASSGMDLDKIKLFDHFPDSQTVRSDVADYYFEVQRFDTDVQQALTKLEKLGVLDNTIVVMTGDHGMPFPRCKANLYDCGARVPMAVQWPAGIKTKNRTVTDFVSTTDLAPTFLELAGVKVPEAMTGKSWRTILESDQAGRIELSRDHVLTGKERHVPGQEADLSGTPMRAIRTDKFLLIHNYEPDRWPAGTPDYKNAKIPSCWIGDCDNGPTKSYMVDNKDKDDSHRRAYDLAFGKRPEYELYDLSTDPQQLVNVAGESKYKDVQAKLTRQLQTELVASRDPRETGGSVDVFETTPYFGSGPRHPSFQRAKKRTK